jgi:hypothetical protein
MFPILPILDIWKEIALRLHGTCTESLDESNDPAHDSL